MKNKYILIFIAFLIVFSPLNVQAVEGDNNQYNNEYQDPWQNNNQTDTYNEGQNGVTNDSYQDPNANNETWNDGSTTEGYYDTNGNWVESGQSNTNNYNDNNWNDGNNSGGYYDANGVWIEGDNTEGYYDSNGVWVEGNQRETQDDGYSDQANETEYQEPVQTYEEPVVEETEPVVEEEVAEEPKNEEGISIQALEGEGYTVSGSVIDDSEASVEGITLVLTDGEESVESQSDANGEFLFEDVAPGTYTLNMKENDSYQTTTEPIDVEVGNRDKLGYSIEVQEIESEEPVEEDAEEEKETSEADDTPVEETETDEKSEESISDSISGLEIILISVGVILLLSTIGVIVYRRFVR